MSSASWFVVCVFAVYRLAELVSNDRIFESFRQWIAKRAATGGKFWKALADLVHCPLCIGVWFALPVAVLYAIIILQSYSTLKILLLWFGIAGAQYFLSSFHLNED